MKIVGQSLVSGFSQSDVLIKTLAIIGMFGFNVSSLYFSFCNRVGINRIYLGCRETRNNFLESVNGIRYYYFTLGLYILFSLEKSPVTMSLLIKLQR